MMKTPGNTADSFQGRFLRIAVLNVRWVNIATNDTVYAVTKHSLVSGNNEERT